MCTAEYKSADQHRFFRRNFRGQPPEEQDPEDELLSRANRQGGAQRPEEPVNRPWLTSAGKNSVAAMNASGEFFAKPRPSDLHVMLCRTADAMNGAQAIAARSQVDSQAMVPPAPEAEPRPRIAETLIMMIPAKNASAMPPITSAVTIAQCRGAGSALGMVPW